MKRVEKALELLKTETPENQAMAVYLLVQVYFESPEKLDPMTRGLIPYILSKVGPYLLKKGIRPEDLEEIVSFDSEAA